MDEPIGRVNDQAEAKKRYCELTIQNLQIVSEIVCS